MKILSVLISILTLALAETSTWTDLRIKFQYSGGLENVDSFWKIGRTLTDALDDGWVTINNRNDLGLTTACFSGEDVRACGLYDSNGFIAGMQLAIPRSDVEGRGVPYSFRNFPVYEMKMLNGDEYWTSMFLTVSPTTLAAGGRTIFDRLGEGLWLKNGSSYTEVPTQERDIIRSTPYTKQNCIPNMGTHFFFATDRNSNCEDSQPFFLLVSEGIINGIGWQIFGRTTPVDRDWYDDVGRRGLDLAVPMAPKCLGDWTEEYGMISVHMYFVDEPWTIRCDQTKDSVAPILGFKKFLLDWLYTSNNILTAVRRKIRFFIQALPIP